MSRYDYHGRRHWLPRRWTFTEFRLFVVLPAAALFCGLMALIEAL